MTTYRAWNLKPLDRSALKELTAAIAQQSTEELESRAMETMDAEPWSEEKYQMTLAAQQKEAGLLAGILAARGITDPAEALTLLCSETRPANQLYVRYRRYTLRHAVQETAAVPLPAEDTLPAAPGPFELLPDEAYNLQHRDFDLVSRNAGPFFLLGEQIIHPTQVSTTVDYGVYLQFLARRGSSEVPLCAATPQNVEITGLAPADIIGIHTYCRDDVLEIIDARYLTRIPKIEKPEVSTPSAE